MAVHGWATEFAARTLLQGMTRKALQVGLAASVVLLVTVGRESSGGLAAGVLIAVVSMLANVRIAEGLARMRTSHRIGTGSAGHGLAMAKLLVLTGAIWLAVGTLGLSPKTLAVGVALVPALLGLDAFVCVTGRGRPEVAGHARRLSRAGR